MPTIDSEGISRKIYLSFFFFFFSSIFKISYVWNFFPACISVHWVCAWCLQRLEIFVVPSGTEVTGGWEPSYGHRKLNMVFCYGLAKPGKSILNVSAWGTGLNREIEPSTNMHQSVPIFCLWMPCDRLPHLLTTKTPHHTELYIFSCEQKETTPHLSCFIRCFVTVISVTNTIGNNRKQEHVSLSRKASSA